MCNSKISKRSLRFKKLKLGVVIEWTFFFLYSHPQITTILTKNLASILLMSNFPMRKAAFHVQGSPSPFIQPLAASSPAGCYSWGRREPSRASPLSRHLLFTGFHDHFSKTCKKLPFRWDKMNHSCKNSYTRTYLGGSAGTSNWLRVKVGIVDLSKNW